MKRRRYEEGQAVLAFAIGIVVIMWLLIGLMDDLGRLALAEIRALDAVELAVQDAANEIDMAAFTGGQRIAISPYAASHAQATAGQLSGGLVTLTGIGYQGQRLTASATLELPMRWMGKVGVPVGRRTFDVSASAAYGLQVEDD